MMDIILMSFNLKVTRKKINTENQLLKELLDARLHFKREGDF